MKRILKFAGWVVAVVLLVVGLAAAYIQVRGVPTYAVAAPALRVDVTPERVERGRRWVTMLCADCHTDPATGQLTGRVMTDAPKEFGPIVSRNITRHPVKGIGSWTDGELAYFLRTGIRRDGQYIPPPMVKLAHMSDEDLSSVIAFLRSDHPLVAPLDIDSPGRSQPSFLVKFLSYVAFKPLPFPDHAIPTPPLSDKVAYGRYLVQNMDCYGCHSPDFTTMNLLEPEKTPGYMSGGNTLLDLKGRPVKTANLTADDETGIGTWSEADFVRALTKGFAPGNRTIRYPMGIMPLSDQEAGAIYAYLRTVPPIRNAVARTPGETAPAGSSAGKQLYYSYGCVSCHGETGAGVGDLRKAAEHFPQDAQLEQWLRHAPQVKLETRMPGWEGVIRDEDYAPLIAYVRELSASH